MRLGARSILLGLGLAASLLLGGCFLFPNELPVATYTATPAEGGTPLYVAFDATDSYDPDGYVSSYSWNFGDGETGSGGTTSHAYTAAGTYSVTLTVRDDSGEGSSATGQIVAHQGKSYAIIVGVADYSASSGLPDLSFTDDDAQSMYSWLRNVGGWNSGNMTWLLNSQATVANLAAAVNALDGASAYDPL
ncbi:MAG: PKD domain-containing protein, partial [Thermotogota bacterium]